MIVLLVELQKHPCPKKIKSEFRVWKTLQPSPTVKNIDDYCRNIRAIQRIRFSEEAEDIIGKPDFRVPNHKIRLNLCIATVRELTGKQEAPLREIFKAIERVGRLCPNWVGPELRLQYKNQPENESLTISMEPIIGSKGELHLFYLDSDNRELWLCTDSFDPNWDDPSSQYYCDGAYAGWYCSGKFVFVLHNK